MKTLKNLVTHVLIDLLEQILVENIAEHLLISLFGEIHHAIDMLGWIDLTLIF